jgi:hypothetical protein
MFTLESTFCNRAISVTRHQPPSPADYADAKQGTPEPDAAGREKAWTLEAGTDSGQALEQESLDRMRVATPNDLKLSDCGGRRGTCMVGGKAAAEAGAVTHGAVRCSAWLGVSGLIGFGSALFDGSC